MNDKTMYRHEFDVSRVIMVQSEHPFHEDVPDELKKEALRKFMEDGEREFYWEHIVTFDDDDNAVTKEFPPEPCNEILHDGLMYLACQEPKWTEHSHDLSGDTRPLERNEIVIHDAVKKLLFAAT